VNGWKIDFLRYAIGRHSAPQCRCTASDTPCAIKCHCEAVWWLTVASYTASYTSHCGVWYTSLYVASRWRCIQPVGGPSRWLYVSLYGAGRWRDMVQGGEPLWWLVWWIKRLVFFFERSEGLSEKRLVFFYKIFQFMLVFFLKINQPLAEIMLVFFWEKFGFSFQFIFI
jgi:hypothetical protein